MLSNAPHPLVGQRISDSPDAAVHPEPGEVIFVDEQGMAVALLLVLAAERNQCIE